MLRATFWTVGLFGAGTALSRLFPGTWTEPLVLLCLGIALLFVSARTARSTVRSAAATSRPARSAAPMAETGVTPVKPAAAMATAAVQGGGVPVERSA